MKKRIILGLVLLASISMLVSSLARAQDATTNADSDSMCTTASTQYLASADQEIANDKALLAMATDDDTRDLLEAKILDLQIEKQELNAQLDMNCP
jgi:hypothetical protein